MTYKLVHIIVLAVTEQVFSSLIIQQEEIMIYLKVLNLVNIFVIM